MKKKKNLSLLLAIILLLSLIPSAVFAFTPYGGAYGAGTYNDPVDYKLVYDSELAGKYSINTPTAAFSVLNSSNTTLATSSSTDKNEISCSIGDVIKFKDLSTFTSGTAIDLYDFQATKDGSPLQSFDTKAEIQSYQITLDQGLYRFYLCVRDNTAKYKTDNWGNWSYNGSHRATGINPGPDGIKGNSDDFYGYWYYSEIWVRVSTNTVSEVHMDQDTNTVLYKTDHAGITETSYTTTSRNFNGKVFVGSKAGMTWDDMVACPMALIASRTANFDTEHHVGFHYYYYKTPIDDTIIAAFLIKQGISDVTDKTITTQALPVNVVLEDHSGGKVTSWHWEYKTSDMSSYLDLGTTQNVNFSLAAEKTYTFRLTVSNATKNDTAIHTVSVVRGQPDNQPPVPIITAPVECSAGDSVYLSGSKSYDPDGYITQYYWETPGATGTLDARKSGSITYNFEGRYIIVLGVTDDKGAYVETSVPIIVNPPSPVALYEASGKLKENRKITLSGLKSYSGSPSYHIVWSAAVWYIKPKSSSISVNDIKVTVPSTIENGAVKVVGVSSFDMLIKKPGDVEITLTVINAPN